MFYRVKNLKTSTGPIRRLINDFLDSLPSRIHQCWGNQPLQQAKFLLPILVNIMFRYTFSIQSSLIHNLPHFLIGGYLSLDTLLQFCLFSHRRTNFRHKKFCQILTPAGKLCTNRGGFKAQYWHHSTTGYMLSSDPLLASGDLCLFGSVYLK